MTTFLRDPSRHDPFRYDPINSEAGEIRLIVLYRYDEYETEQVECRLIHTTLASASGSYGALSYVWGSPDCQQNISLIGKGDLLGHQFPVTRNLEEALRNLRLRERDWTLWIDALCINQADDAERSAQVALMPSIYSGALNTMVYFGPDDDDSERGMAFIRRCAETIYMDQLPKSVRGGRDRLNIEDHPVRKLLMDSFDVETLLRIYNRPWWRRIWITQELALSKQATLQWGKRVLPWECCARTIGATFNYMKYLGDESRESPTWKEINECKFWTLGITQTCDGFHDIKYRRPFLELLVTFWLSEASDPRDKVYALLGLAVDDHPGALKPDYSLPYGQVYGMVVKDVMTRSGELDILSQCSSTGIRRVEGLPTWAPDWTSQGKKTKREVSGYNTIPFYLINTRPDLLTTVDVKQERKRRFCASREPNSPDTVEFSEDFLELSLTGLSVGIILQLSPVRSYEIDEDEINQVWGVMGDSLTSYPTRRPVWLEYYATLCADQVDFPGRAQGTYAQWQICRAMVTSGRKFMRIDGNLMGLAVAEAEVGDLVVIARGSRVPLISRPEGDHFLMVGEAFVQGIMYGEAYEIWGDRECPEMKFRIL